MGRTPLSRCTCNDALLEELLCLRQSMEKAFKRLEGRMLKLTNEVLQLQQSKKGCDANCHQPTAPVESPKRMRDSTEYLPKLEEINIPIGEDELPPEDVDDKDSIDDGDEEAEEDPSFFLTVSESELEPNLTSPPRTEPSVKGRRLITAKSVIHKVKRPAREFYGVQSPVIPVRPFEKLQELLDWENLLTTDEDQREQLRVELMNENHETPAFYVRSIFFKILGQTLPNYYTYKGNAITNRRPIKNLTFVAIFKECFLKLFHNCNEAFFVEHTKRFFNNAHFRGRRQKRVRTIEFETAAVSQDYAESEHFEGLENE